MRSTLTAALAALSMTVLLQPAQAQDKPVDLELIFAVDVSQSVDGREGAFQRSGYVQALTDPEVVSAILSGAYGSIAVMFIEWAGPNAWRPVVDWRIIDSAEAAQEFADLLSVAPSARGQSTSISAMLDIATGLFDFSGAEGTRRVIDISGDGPNNRGGNVAEARDAAVAAGVTINGVAINNYDGTLFSLPDLDRYYRECVVGGPGAFVITAAGFEAFGEAIRRKLILEIAGRMPEVILAQADGPGLALPEPKYAPECDIGERMRFRDNPNAPP